MCEHVLPVTSVNGKRISVFVIDEKFSSVQPERSHLAHEKRRATVPHRYTKIESALPKAGEGTNGVCFQRFYPEYLAVLKGLCHPGKAFRVGEGRKIRE